MTHSFLLKRPWILPVLVTAGAGGTWPEAFRIVSRAELPVNRAISLREGPAIWP